MIQIFDVQPPILSYFLFGGWRHQRRLEINDEDLYGKNLCFRNPQSLISYSLGHLVPSLVLQNTGQKRQPWQFLAWRFVAVSVVTATPLNSTRFSSCSIFFRKLESILPAGYPDENVYVPWVTHTAHQLFTPGHQSGDPPPTRAVTGKLGLCLCAFSFPDKYPKHLLRLSKI